MPDVYKRQQQYCQATGQHVPESRGEIMRCIYESLALKYRYTHRALEEITGERYGAIHMIGGGTQAALLCQMTADACGVPVIAGPVEEMCIRDSLISGPFRRYRLRRAGR